jgi:hypothetical protein
MPQSESIAKLADALCKAQAMMKPVQTNQEAKGEKFSYKYADLASVWDTIREPLTKNGLSVTQIPVTAEAGIGVETLLMHTSGEWVRGEFFMRPVKSDPQAFGSCLTYARRYALAAIMGVCTEDDDGEAATCLDPIIDKQKPVAHQSAPGAPVSPPPPAGATAFLWRLGAHKNKPIEQIESGYLDWASKNMKADDHRQAAIAELMRREGVSQPTLPEDEIPEFVEEDPAY